MISDGSFALALGLMAIAVFATRIAGAVLMARVTPSPRVERFLEGLAVSVVSALVASSLVTAEAKYAVAVLIAIAATVITRSVIWAMCAGMIAAAMLPHIVSGF